MDIQARESFASNAEAIKTWVDGKEARQPATSASDLQLGTSTTRNPIGIIGIDLPGVEAARPEIPHACAGREGDAGEVSARGLAGSLIQDGAQESLRIVEAPGGLVPGVPAPGLFAVPTGWNLTPAPGLSARERDRLLGELLFAARDLAQEQIEPREDTDLAFCFECMAAEVLATGWIAHEAACKTGRVLGIISALCTAAASSNPAGLNQNEPAHDCGQGGAR